ALRRLARLCLRPQLHLHPARLAAFERLVGLDRILERLALRQHLRGINRARGDEIDEVRQVAPVRRVARLDGEVLKLFWPFAWFRLHKVEVNTYSLTPFGIRSLVVCVEIIFSKTGSSLTPTAAKCQANGF